LDRLSRRLLGWCSGVLVGLGDRLGDEKVLSQLLVHIGSLVTGTLLPTGTFLPRGAKTLGLFDRLLSGPSRGPRSVVKILDDLPTGAVMVLERGRRCPGSIQGGLTPRFTDPHRLGWCRCGRGSLGDRGLGSWCLDRLLGWRHLVHKGLE